MIASLDNPDFVVLPELALCSYMASNEIFKYADENSKDTSEWSIEIVRKYNIYIGVAICYDAKRKHFYNNIHDEKLSMILFPHGCPADPTKQKRRRKY